LKPTRTLLPVLMWASLVALHADEPDRARLAQGSRPLLRTVADFQNSADRTPLQSWSQPYTNEQRVGRSAICCHLMNLGYDHNTRLTGDPRRFTFTGGTGDPQWLTRDDRGRWSV
jgi:hypothetical protein